ncbi:YndJ family protein [Streptomyces sp. NPDC050529]|uniref:YndJ family protein n=1 Tax=unclassified Streptomyces TaxID=2593676 RepID=UPI002DD9D3BA|nr:YndJ family protein [Streptomyces sp. NBC_01022]WRZ86948.1 YndJ family protein [Streptomyces sp. NBC_01022]WRZ87394.1 YndJ family protein [Streptomyces sp. NBC_01022]
MSVLVGLIVMLGMLVIVPVGLRLADVPEPARIRRLWPLFAVPGAVALWLPRGPAATVLALGYGLGTVLLALHAPARIVRRPQPLLSWRTAPAEVALLTALVTPAVAATALVAERSGRPLFGFGLGILALTVPHFHFAGFAAALVSGLVSRVADSAAGRFAALSVPLGTLLVLIGYFIGDWAELAGAVVLTAGMWTVAFLTWRTVRPAARDRPTRLLLAASAAVLAATMVLALSWALGEATGLPHPTLTWMAATHGVGNALGFALCSVLAWQRLNHRTTHEGRTA